MNALPNATQLCAPSRVTLGLEDWDLLFTAVCGRLRQLACAPEAADVALVRMQTGVPECVLALEQLHAQVQLAWACRQPFEASVMDAGPPRSCTSFLGEFAGAQLRSLRAAATAGGEAGATAAGA